MTDSTAVTTTISSTNTNNTIVVVSTTVTPAAAPPTTSHDIISSTTLLTKTTTILANSNNQEQPEIQNTTLDDYLTIQSCDDCHENTLSSTSSSNDQTTTNSVGNSTTSRSILSTSFTFDSPSDSLSFIGTNNKKYKKRQYISHQILTSELHYEHCKLMKRDFSGACAVFIVRFRKFLDEEHDYVQRRIDLDGDQFEFQLKNDETTTPPSFDSKLCQENILTLNDILIDKNQANRLERKDTESYGENDRVWIQSSNPLFDEEENDFVNPLHEMEQEIPSHLLMFYHTCHYENSRESSKFVSHLDGLTPADMWTEVINPLSLSGICRTQTAQRELQQFMKHKISKLKDPLSTTSTFSFQKKSEKRRSKRASSIFNRMSFKQENQSMNTPISATLTSKEWQDSVLEEEFKINVNLETEFEEFCNPLFEHETHNYLLPDGLKFSDLWRLVNEMKTECPPMVNKIIYTRSNLIQLEEEQNFKHKLNRILSIGGHHQGHARTSSSSTREVLERRRTGITRRYTQLNQEPERRDTIVEETNVINIEKMKLTVDGESMFNYLRKKAQGYLTDADIVELLSFILDTQRKNINGCRDISNNLVLLSPVPYNAYEYLEFSPNTIYRYVDDDNPIFYNAQILNIIPEKKKLSLVSESELMSKLFHKGTVSLESIYSNSIPSESAFLLDTPNYTIKLLIILENLMAIIQKEYFMISEHSIDYYSFKQSENYKLTTRFSSMLRNFDPIKLDRNQKKSFFINLHNLMLLHTFCEKRYIAIEEEYENFYNEPSYLVGRYKLSMSDIMDYILRERPIPEWKFYIREYQLNFLEGQFSYDNTSTLFDARIHFVMSDGRKSSPLPQAIDQMTIERIIDTSTRRYINENIACSENSIELPSIFQQYKEDFSPVNGSIFGVLNFISKHLRKSNQIPFFALLKKSNITESQLEYYANLSVAQPNNFNNFPILSFQINYTPADFSSNCLMFEQFVGNDNSKPISFEEVLRNANYRSQLRAFSEIECSMENIEFYDHVERYKTITDMEQRWKFAHKMYEKFLISDSPSEVNVNKRLISTAARQIFRTKGEDETYVKLPLDLFDRLNKEVEMVLFDTYSRFTNTEAYHNLVLSSRRKTAANASMASGSGSSFLLSNKNKFTESLLDLMNSTNIATPNSAMSNMNLDSDLSPFTTSSTSSSTDSSPRPPIERKMSKIGLLAQVFERNDSSVENQSFSLSSQSKPSAVSPRLQTLMEVFSNTADSNNIDKRRMSTASTDSTSSNVSTSSRQ